jgi:hypothetical protein
MAVFVMMLSPLVRLFFFGGRFCFYKKDAAAAYWADA